MYTMYMYKQAYIVSEHINKEKYRTMYTVFISITI